MGAIGAIGAMGAIGAVAGLPSLVGSSYDGTPMTRASDTFSCNSAALVFFFFFSLSLSLSLSSLLFSSPTINCFLYFCNSAILAFFYSLSLSLFFLLGIFKNHFSETDFVTACFSISNLNLINVAFSV